MLKLTHMCLFLPPDGVTIKNASRILLAFFYTWENKTCEWFSQAICNYNTLSLVSILDIIDFIYYLYYNYYSYMIN